MHAQALIASQSALSACWSGGALPYARRVRNYPVQLQAPLSGVWIPFQFHSPARVPQLGFNKMIALKRGAGDRPPMPGAECVPRQPSWPPRPASQPPRQPGAGPTEPWAALKGSRSCFPGTRNVPFPDWLCRSSPDPIFALLTSLPPLALRLSFQESAFSTWNQGSDTAGT